MTPLPAFRGRKTVLGLDIGAGFGKVAVVDYRGGAPRLAKIAVTSLEDGSVPDGEIVQPDRVAEAIASMFERERIAQRDVVTGVGGRDVICKLIEVDRMDEDEAREVIPWEAEQHVPFDMTNVQMDFVITDPMEDTPRMKVLLAVAKTELIEARISLLRQSGLTPAAISVETFALRNALEANYPDAMEGVTALVDIGAAGTTVNVMDDGVPVLVRDVAFGTREVVRGLQRSGDLSPAAARTLLGNGAAGPMLREVLMECAGAVAKGIQRAGALVESDDPGLGIARVYLCGGGAAVEGLSAILAEWLGLETRVASAFELLEVGPGVADHAELPALAPALMLPVGLALRESV